MSEHTKDTLLALLFAGLGIVILLWALLGCATPNEPFPEGYAVSPHPGYIKHCNDYPESIFCVQDNN